MRECTLLCQHQIIKTFGVRNEIWKSIIENWYIVCCYKLPYRRTSATTCHCCYAMLHPVSARGASHQMRSSWLLTKTSKRCWDYMLVIICTMMLLKGLHHFHVLQQTRFHDNTPVKRRLYHFLQLQEWQNTGIQTACSPSSTPASFRGTHLGQQDLFSFSPPSWPLMINRVSSPVRLYL